MKVKHLLLSSVLALPGLLLPLASCDDSKVPSEPAIDEPTDNLDAPSFTTVGFGAFSHDPHIKGPKLRTFAGPTDSPGSGCTGSAKRFRSQDGAEVKVEDTSAPGSCSYAGVYPATNQIKGKLLTQVKELDFSYAGGSPQGGSPRFSIPIDENNDGNWDNFAFADATDASGCNDGDAFVGTVNGADDETCNWFYATEIAAYPNWEAFASAHPTWRIARNTTPFVIVDRGPAHYLLWNLDLR